MLTEELAQAQIQERMREAAKLRRQRQARKRQARTRRGGGATPRSALSQIRIGRFPFTSIICEFPRAFGARSFF